MTDSSAVIDGAVKYRDGKKWKPRWCVIRKLSPVADCLTLQFYRDVKEKCKNGPTKSSLSLERFLGMESGFTLDKESNTIALICSDVAVILAFDSRELLIQWQVKIKSNVSEVQQFLVNITHIPTKSKLPVGPARLHLRNYSFSLVAAIPPRLLGSWQLEDLRRYGVVEAKFCFEGGSKCGRDEGLHILQTSQAAEVSNAFDLASRGRLQGKRRPVSRAIDMAYGQKSCLKSPDVCSSRESERPLLWNCDVNSGCDGCSVIGDEYLNQCCASHQKTFLSPQSRESVALSSNDFNSTRTSCVALSEISSHCCPDKSDGCASESVRNHTYIVDRRLLIDRCSSCMGITIAENHAHDDFADEGEEATNQRRKLSDRDSVASGGSSSSSSEFNGPRTCPESFYDRPKRFSHINDYCSCRGNKGASSPRSPLKSPLHKQPSGALTYFHYPSADGANVPFSKRLKGPCLSRRRALVNNGAVSHENLSMINKCAAHKCLCNNRSDSLDRNPKTKMKLDQFISGRPVSPFGSPKLHSRRLDLRPVVKKCESVIHKGGTNSAINPTGPNSCTCTNHHTHIGPYGNYDIPPSARRKETCGAKSTNGTNTRQIYDVPKQFHLNENCSGQNGECKEQPKETRVDGNIDESISDDDKLWQQQQHNICPCQKMMLWAENWLPCRRRESGADEPIPICGSLGRNVGTKRMQKSCCTCQIKSEGRHQSEVTARREARHRHPKDDSSGSEQSRVSVNSRESGYQSSESKETDNDSDIAKDAAAKDLENYTNIEFVDSLPLYENTTNVLGKAGISNVSQESDAPALPIKSPALSKRLPPIPPSSSIVTNVCSACQFQMLTQSQDKVDGRKLSTSESDAGDDNYLEMQPIMTEDYEDGIPSGEYLTMCDVNESLPLRPFMPYTLPARLLDNEDDNDDSQKGSHVKSSPLINKKLHIFHSKSGRSSSLVELKRNLIPKKRSTSVDSLDDSGSDDSEEETNLNKKKSRSRKHSLFSKFSLRSKNKCKSSDELSPKELAKSKRLPRAHNSVEFLSVRDEEIRPAARRHHSIDKTDYDLPVAIKRSSSVPCKADLEKKTEVKKSVTTCRPKEDAHRFRSLPRNFKKNKNDLKCEKDIENAVQQRQQNENIKNDEVSNEQTDVICTPAEESLAMTVSRGSSVEEEPIRNLLEDVDIAISSPQTKDRPRTGDEYQRIDRSQLKNEQNSPHVENEMSRPMTSRSSYLPNVTKEINYLEVDPECLEKRPRSVVIKSEEATQYAVIDLIATKAARRIGNERERERQSNSVRSSPALSHKSYCDSTPSSPRLRRTNMK